MTKKLPPRQQKFVDEYLLDMNALQACIRAGYSAKTAHVQSAQLMKIPEIKAQINEALRIRSEKTGIDAEFVLHKAAEMLDMCLGNKPVKKVIVSDGVPESMDVKEFNAAGAGKALELLGKHVNIGAFKDKIEMSGHITHEEMLEKLK